MTILGIETSFDETSAAFINNGTDFVYQYFSTSMAKHISTGGVVPEVASREQSIYIIPVLQQVLTSMQSHHSNIDAIAVTVGPGLIGSLLIGVETAKALAYAWDKPLIPVNHMLGHIYGVWLTYGQDMNQQWPKLALLASGGHTELILMESHAKFYKIGQTLDDAAGEAFDKVARLLGYPYPGGPHVSTLAELGNPQAINFPLPLRSATGYNFSFSGLKTAVLHYVKDNPSASKADIAASFQQTVITHLLRQTQAAAHKFAVKEVILGGGVAANKQLRSQLVTALQPIIVRIPDLKYTTDNAAVIASAAYYHQNFASWRYVQADPSLELPSIIDP
jgi:N6-L-threonylcarbamoyladenine synthase